MSSIPGDFSRIEFLYRGHRQRARLVRNANVAADFFLLNETPRQ